MVVNCIETLGEISFNGSDSVEFREYRAKCRMAAPVRSESVGNLFEHGFEDCLQGHSHDFLDDLVSWAYNAEWSFTTILFGDVDSTTCRELEFLCSEELYDFVKLFIRHSI